MAVGKSIWQIDSIIQVLYKVSQDIMYKVLSTNL